MSDVVTRYRLRFAEVETGILLDADGSRHLGTGTRFEPVFATRDEAIAVKDDLLAKFPFAEVWLTGNEGECESERFVDEGRFERYIVDMRRWRQWASAFPLRRLFMRRPINPRDPRL